MPSAILSVGTKSAEYYRVWYYKDRERILAVKARYRAKHPWRMILAGIRQRCENPKCSKYKSYGARGIISTLTEPQMKRLWIRDRAYQLQRPSIDRIDHLGNYTFKNCRFIELTENSKRALSHRGRRQDGTFT